MLDQAIHMLIAFLVLCLFTLDHILSGAACGFMMGMIREITEEGPKVKLHHIRDALNSWEDLSFWTIGGLLAKIVTM